MYGEIAGTDERVRGIPGVRDRRVQATNVRLYASYGIAPPDQLEIRYSHSVNNPSSIQVEYGILLSENHIPVCAHLKSEYQNPAI